VSVVRLGGEVDLTAKLVVLVDAPVLACQIDRLFACHQPSSAHRHLKTIA
jgi:hypothetical protein